MKKNLFTLKVCLLTSALALWSIATTAQSRSSGSKSPAGAAYMFNDGSTVTKTGETLSTSTSDYNGTINKNGYMLTYSSLSGSGTINEATGIEEVRNQVSDGRGEIYTLDGRRANASTKGIVIQDGRKVVKK